MPSSLYKVIAIGASVGGLKTLYSLFDALKQVELPPVLIVQHLHRSTENVCTFFEDIDTHLNFVQVDDKLTLESNCVYIAPPDYHMYVEQSHTISLSIDDKVCYSRPSVDVLFESVAKVFGKKSIGIVLSGANSDGANGLAILKDAGAYTIIQDPETAECAVMPRAALSQCKVDFSSSVRGIADNLKKTLV